MLVGVCPNPITQIDQITYALIYKFMDDMDQASIKAGGEASFFVGDLKKYSWSDLMSTRIANQEKMDLYSESLTKFSEAKQLPELFRTIFRAAFLPYRSPETLGLFLKEISYFDYTHPEELGNAYEYLLSKMSSQGDAGQFRTPRHIIDFIVDVINPIKDDKVLDPACGTGGFLVSTYNHILEQHDGKNDPTKKEKPLTPDERKRLMSNLEGYDIDPTMVRIGLVNMYLHQFKNPQIFQYDTLTNEERWNDKYDVIFANPPFMSPKGGIRPHNKFGVSSHRAEVLFVDYIMNHLKPKGRAGIVVPEGIIFQSGKPYKELRKNLIENGLFAVVSLPAGVFQPYSGVKTSILLLDNELAKEKSEIAFLKISADGFDLGATKRPVSENDLPGALEFLNEWVAGKNTESPLVTLVAKEEISANGDYNLSGDRYKISGVNRNSDWPLVPLGDLVEVLNGFAFKSELYSDNGTRVIRITNVQKGFIKDDEPKYYPDSSNSEISRYLLKENDLLVSLTGNVGRVALLPKSFLPAALNQRVACLRVSNTRTLNEKYLFHILNLDSFEQECIANSSGVAQKNLSTEWLKTFRIPLPPLEIQEQLIAELDSYAAIISGAKQVVENWKPSIAFEASSKLVKLNNFCRIQNGYAFSSTAMGEHQNDFLPVIKIGNVGLDGFISKKFKYHAYSKKLEPFLLSKGDIVIAMTGATVGKVATIPEGRFLLNQRVGKIVVTNDLVLLDYVRLALQSTKFYEYCQLTATGGAQGNISAEEILEFKIPLLPLESQKKLCLEAEKERQQISSIFSLIGDYEERIKIALSELWNDGGGE